MTESFSALPPRILALAPNPRYALILSRLHYPGSLDPRLKPFFATSRIYSTRFNLVCTALQPSYACHSIGEDRSRHYGRRCSSSTTRLNDYLSLIRLKSYQPVFD